MEDWATLVRSLQAEQENQKQFQDMAKAIFHAICTRKIKDMRKFEQRLGPDYEKLIEDLKFPEDKVKDLLNNDEFFESTLKLRKTYK
jgi:hypothetical protein